MKNNIKLVVLVSSLYLVPLHMWATSHSAGYGGSTEISIPEGNFTAPTYRVLSAGLSGEVAYYGVVDASDNSSKSVSFSIDTNATGDRSTFCSRWCFDQHSSPQANSGCLLVV